MKKILTNKILAPRETVRRLMTGTKSRMTRLVRPQIYNDTGPETHELQRWVDCSTGSMVEDWVINDKEGNLARRIRPSKNPHYTRGYKLWVAEQHFEYPDKQGYRVLEYGADIDPIRRESLREYVKPPMSMDRKDSRITLEVTSNKIDWLRNIDKEDIKREGFNTQAEFIKFWDSRKVHNRSDTSGSRTRWGSNPLVYVTYFDTYLMNIDDLMESCDEVRSHETSIKTKKRSLYL